MFTNNNYTAKLENRCVGALNGRFFIPDYQRGYRWGRQNVHQLLEDIYNQSQGAYYLQPIVVCPHISNNNEEETFDYDVIDGQQRLTTIYIIYKVLSFFYNQTKNQPFKIITEDLATWNFSIAYETRKGSEKYLQQLEQKKLVDAQQFIDYLYMYHAYNEVLEWFSNDVSKISQIARSLKDRVFFIWYEVQADENHARAIFERLNIGKIRLTNAELVKALFLSQSSSNVDESDKNIIGEQWDDIERQLHDSKFWSFLTNQDETSYSTKIELLFDMIANKKENERDEYFTFFYMDNLLKGKDRKKEWDNIYLQFLKLKDWYLNSELYHKIGYLVTITNNNRNPLQELYRQSCNENMTNSKFKKTLDDKIRESMNFKSLRIENLSYGKNDSEIYRLLTLFNVMTIYQLKDDTQRYPFYLHKRVHGGWSLEHIHAQHSESLNKSEQWNQWTKLHLESLNRYYDLKRLEDENSEALQTIKKLQKKMSDFLENKNTQTQSAFNDITSVYAQTVVEKGGFEYKDQLSNIALLGRDDNSMLSNSTFDVKRELVTKKIMATSYVPLCTQRVFLKSYTPTERNQLFFWGQNDRDAYIAEIKRVLRDYLRPLNRNVEKLFEDNGLKDVYHQLKNELQEKLSHEQNTPSLDSYLQSLVPQNRYNDSLDFYESIVNRKEEMSASDFKEELKSVFNL